MAASQTEYIIVAFEHPTKMTQERRAVASYLALLESSQQSGEKLSEYIADLWRLVIEGYPTTNDSTRKAIALHQFLKRLPDRQAAVSVGMTHPTTVEAARTALDTYQILREESSKLPKVGTVQEDEEYVRTGQLQKFGEELKSSVTQSMDTNLIRSCQGEILHCHAEAEAEQVQS